MYCLYWYLLSFQSGACLSIGSLMEFRKEVIIIVPTIFTQTVTPPTFDWSTAFAGIDATYIMSAIFGCAPTILPIAIGCLAARKGLRFALGMLRRS